MNFSFNKILLYSKNKELLAGQISTLFDSQINNSKTGIELIQDGPLFKIMDGTKRSEVNVDNTIFEYQISSMEELKELLQKLEFFYYRHSENFQDQKLPIIDFGFYEQSFTLIDIDGRQWKFIVTDH